MELLTPDPCHITCSAEFICEGRAQLRRLVDGDPEGLRVAEVRKAVVSYNHGNRIARRRLC